MLDSDLSPKLLEVNINPAMFLDTPTLTDMLPPLVRDTVNLACDIHQPFLTETTKEAVESALGSCELKWTVLHSECK